ncbi:SDR family NAD(P)-dependent oxidoreductase [Phytoactinopolyspora limicola]|uniref:SDR family NAD(P)-dependent oxidoreductase n=1 Tax=Phytoactinopolyspora limicola TaxID=2715536 RepID=UPI00140A0CFA|nr:SDR family NAD(P)-dependent oxidoreductase [Phytoactinopolyspora limicola]
MTPQHQARALVVGGSRGIGAAVAQTLAEAGWPTTIAARRRTQLDHSIGQAAAQGRHLAAAEVDVTSPSSVARLFTDIAQGGPLGVCVMAAGRNLSKQLIRAPRHDGDAWSMHGTGEWQEIIDLCLTGTFLVGRHAALTMAQAGTPGVIVPIASSTWPGSWGQSAYAAAKAGVVSLTRSWALELAEFGVRVVAVAPGVVNGQALREKSADNPAHGRFIERLRHQVPLRRFAEESEIAAAVQHAVDNTYLTGTVLEVSGGGFPARIT